MRLVNQGVLVTLFVLWVGTHLVRAQIPFAGRCPVQTVVTPFNATQYLGQWYEQERYFSIFQTGGKCATAIYTDSGDGQIKVNNAQINAFTGLGNTIEGYATYEESPLVGKLTVRFPSVGNMPAPYWILDTDYFSYSVVWSCTNVWSIINTQFLWLLTRERNPAPEFMTRVKNIVKSRGLSTDSLSPHVQDCL